MNCVELIGRLTRDPEVRYTAEQTCVASFTIAIDRPKRKDAEKQTDFPRIVTWGRLAETCEKYAKTGKLVGVQGSIQTGSYTNKNGDTVYTTDIKADRVDFLDWGNTQQKTETEPEIKAEPVARQQTFEEIDEDVPF